MENKEEMIEIKGELLRSNAKDSRLYFLIIFAFCYLKYALYINAVGKEVTKFTGFVVIVIIHIVKSKYFSNRDTLSYNDTIYFNYNKVKIDGYARKFSKYICYFDIDGEKVIFVPYIDFNIKRMQQMEISWIRLMNKLEGLELELYKKNIPEVKFKFCLAFFIYIIERICFIIIFLGWALTLT